MKTKFTKVAVSERLPSKDNKYFVIDITGELNKVPFRDAEFHSWQPIHFWLEESPDREDEMIEMLERVFNLCDKLQFPTEKQLSDLKTEIKSLLQSLKQEK